MVEKNNFAYIDAANLHNAITDLGWQLDYARFRIWLKEKYNVSQAYIFIGLIPKYKDLYTYLQESGFTLIFKETIYDGNGKPKGNCDADLVVQTMTDLYEENFNKAIIISSDGDYASLVKVLKDKEKLEAILSPATANKCSILLKRLNVRISYLDEQKSILEK
ncbi:MAG TPA: NYN domain-containing protein [Candidatus Paceibacterota bacterium]|nr:NYN domain-containing protein [Candidatus Paceibacterota bacterium]HQI26345.1 NYN domain-containing protein [Candidatus Paceibacterota bacterium]HQJ83995.1 NYN domain-containing protein [Candidatus Paceibacterota bacterium]